MRLNTCTSICSLDGEAFMHATNVSNDEYLSQQYASQEYDTQFDDDNLDIDKEGFVVKGRTANYKDEDVLICTAWKRVSLDASVGSEQALNKCSDHIKEYFVERNTSGHFQSRDVNVGAPSIAKYLLSVPEGTGKPSTDPLVCDSCIHVAHLSYSTVGCQMAGPPLFTTLH